MKLDVRVGSGLATILLLLLLSPVVIQGRSAFATTTLTWSNLIELCSKAVVFSIVAIAAGAWYASRPGRLRTSEFTDRIGGRYHPLVSTELLFLSGAAFLILNLEFLITSSLMWQSVTIGAFPWPAIVIANLYAGCYLMLGYAIGSLVRTWFAPLLAAALGYLLLILGLLVSGGRALLITTAYERIFGTSARERPDLEQARNIIVWLALLMISLICLIGVVRRRSLALWVGTATLFLCSSLFAHVAMDHGAVVEANGMPFYDVTPSCETSGAISYCVHPLDARYSVGLASAIQRVVDPVQDVATFHTSFYGYGLNEHSRPDHAVYLPFRGSIDATTFAFALQVTTGMDAPRSPTASQVAIACGLVDIANLDGCFISPFHIREGRALQSHDEVEELEARINGARSRFVAMRVPDRQTWIANNWAALVAGTLTLEEIR